MLRAFACFALLLCQSLAARELVLGTVSTRPEYHIPRLQPIVEFAAIRLHSLGITRGRVLLARDAAQLQQYMAEGKLDWAGVTIAVASELTSSGAASPELLALDARGRGYQSLYFVRRDSPMQSLTQLPGHKLALRSKSSTSSYFVPLLHLAELQLRTEMLPHYRARPATGAVGILISGSETNSAFWVAHGLADMGVANSLDWSDQRLFPDALKARLKVIETSPPVPLGIELFSHQTPIAVRNELRRILLAAKLDPDGKAAMRTYSNTVQFESLSPALMQEFQQFAMRFKALRAHSQGRP
jgi:phosphonate transport system substrate-binding protein